MQDSSSPPRRIIALVGSYRKEGVSDTAVDEVLQAAREAGAQTAKVYLADRHIEFCTNCRSCTQESGPLHGACVLQDDMPALLEEIEGCDALVLASPMNFFTVTAIMKRFIERLVCYAHWPWGAAGPRMRPRRRTKRAVLIVSTASPSFMILPFSHIRKIMKQAAFLLGAPNPRMLWLGMSALQRHTTLSKRQQRKARNLGKWLAQ